jgi:hypothetical protein
VCREFCPFGFAGFGTLFVAFVEILNATANRSVIRLGNRSIAQPVMKRPAP